MTGDDYENAISTAMMYNGLDTVVRTWAELGCDGGHISCPEGYGLGEGHTDRWAYQQLQFVWMIGVLLFGDYGTSPRFGWIDKIDAWRSWVCRITDDNEEGGSMAGGGFI